MALNFDQTRDIVLEELRAKGYSPNPGDILGIVTRLVALSKEGDVAPVPAPIAATIAPVQLPPKS